METPSGAAYDAQDGGGSSVGWYEYGDRVYFAAAYEGRAYELDWVAGVAAEECHETERVVRRRRRDES